MTGQADLKHQVTTHPTTPALMATTVEDSATPKTISIHTTILKLGREDYLPENQRPAPFHPEDTGQYERALRNAQGNHR